MSSSNPPKSTLLPAKRPAPESPAPKRRIITDDDEEEDVYVSKPPTKI